MGEDVSTWALGQLGGPRTSCKLEDALPCLPVAYCLPLVAAGFTEAKHGALRIDAAHALQELNAGVAALLQPVHLLLLIYMLLHSSDLCI